MKRIAFLGSMTMVLALVAAPVLASNTGFKLNYGLKGGGKNLISLPYFYYPDGNINAPAASSAACTPTVGPDCENSEDLCLDLMTSTGATGCATLIKNIVKYNRNAQGKLIPISYSCGAT